MTRLVVEAGFGYAVTSASIVWTDVTQFVDEIQGVRITRGAADELSDIQPGTCSMVLDNADGRFTPTLATSPYYPNVKKNTPIRVRVVTTAKNLITNTSFETDTSSWSATGSPLPTLARSTVRAQHGTASGLVTWGAGGTPAVETTLYGLDVGVTYTASAYVWVPATHPAVRLGIAGGTTGSASTTNDAWQRITVTWTATSTSHRLQVTPATAPTSGQQVWVDAAQAEAGASATAFDSDAAQIHPRFFGMVNQWPIKWAGLQATVNIACTDFFKWLSRLPTLQPMLVEEILADDPLAYYTLAEPSDSTTAGDLSGTTAGAMSILQAGSGGTLAFAGQDGPAATGQQAPILTPASSTAGKYLSADLGTDYEQAAVNWLFFEVWFKTSTQGRVIFSLRSTSNRYKIAFLLEAGTGKLAVEWTAVGGSLTASVANTANLADGAWHWMLYDEEEGDIYIDGQAAQAVSVDPMLQLRHLTVGAHSADRLWNGSIAHLALHAPTPSGSVPASEYTPHYTAGTTGFSGETASTRVARLAGYAGITVTTSGSTFSTVASQGALGSSALAHLREVETTESARLFASRSSGALVFQSRGVRFNPVSAATLEYADLETDDVELSDDDQKVVNTVIASRPGGATVRVLDQDSRDTYGPYERPLDLLKTTDNEVVDAANWLVQRGADPPPEIRQVPVEASTMPLATYRALLGADVSTVLTLTGLPGEAPASTATVTVEGYTETITANWHHIDFHTSRTITDAVWVLDDAVYSVLGTTTRLAY